MIYQLYDVQGARLLGSGKSEAEIMPIIRGFLATGDVSYLSDLSLVSIDSAERVELIAEGNELAARALANTSIVPVAA